MALVDPAVEEQTFSCLNPASGDVVATFPVHSAADVREAVARARPAAAWWAALGFDERRRRLLAVRGAAARRAGAGGPLVPPQNGNAG
jgi:acyl-CoA reductase-like NAD-dependent aldehyde dehydrogenase